VTRLAIVGTGLIGASAGLAARRAGVTDAAGWDDDADALEVAAERGAVVPADSLEEALAGADIALVAVPVASLPLIVRSALEHAPVACAVTDVGSTKGAVCAA
jgi:prephenate dehydrogenase